MRLDNSTTDRQAYTQPIDFGRKERIKYLLAQGGKAFTRITHTNLHRTILSHARGNSHLAPLDRRITHRIKGISHQIQDDLFDFDSIDKYRRQIFGKFRPHHNLFMTRLGLISAGEV